MIKLIVLLGIIGVMVWYSLSLFENNVTTGDSSDDNVNPIQAAKEAKNLIEGRFNQQTLPE
ncbi:MAG: hypothetical protein AAB468_00290 [Patescibacteria group bacterium]